MQGFQDVRPLRPAKRLFTIAQLVGGLGVVLYTAGAVAQKIEERIDAGDSLVVLAETGEMGRSSAGWRPPNCMTAPAEARL